MSTASAQAATGDQAASVTRIARRRPRAGQAPAYEALAREMLATMRQRPGFQRGELIPPAESDGDYHLISRWDSAAALGRWDGSPERAAILARMNLVAETEPQYRVLTGLEAFFGLPVVPASMHPPRARMAFVTWLGIFPTVAFYLWFVMPWLADWPFLPRTALLTLLIVYTMSYGVAPWLTRWLRPFLHPTT